MVGSIDNPVCGLFTQLPPTLFSNGRRLSVWLGLSLGIGGILAVLSSKYAYKFGSSIWRGQGDATSDVNPWADLFLNGFNFGAALAVLLFIFNFGFMNVQEPLLADYYNRHIKSEIRATALSSINMISSIYITLTGILIGWLADIKLAWGFLLMGTIIIFGAIAFRINDKNVLK